MASDTVKTTSASRKRKFSIYSLSHNLVHFKIDGKRYSIDEDLLDYHSSCWRTTLDHITAKDDEDDEEQCANCPHTGHIIQPCVFRGLTLWFYDREIPTDDLIKQSDYPKEWEEGDEDEPLACSMAIELYYLAATLGIHQLMDDALLYLFLEYKDQRIAPSMVRIQRIFRHSEINLKRFALQKFAVQIYYKWGEGLPGPTWDTLPAKEAEHISKEFLFYYFAFSSEYNSQASMQDQQGEDLFLDFCHYHKVGCNPRCLAARLAMDESFYIL